MAREHGSGVTPERVVELLRNEVAEKSMLAVSRSTGLGLAAIGRYLKGVGEPTTATLQKLASYFDTTVMWLRGDPYAGRHGGIDFNLVLAGREDMAARREAMADVSDNLMIARAEYEQVAAEQGLVCQASALGSIGDTVKGNCVRCGGEVLLHLDQGSTGDSPLVVTVQPCTTCCKG